MSCWFIVIKYPTLFKILQPENLNPNLTFSCTLTAISPDFVVGVQSVGIMNYCVSSRDNDDTQ